MNSSGNKPAEVRSFMTSSEIRTWCERSLRALASLWDGDYHSAWRTSREEEAKPEWPFPTATFHAIRAFAQWDALRVGCYQPKRLSSPLITVDDIRPVSSARQILDGLLALGRGTRWYDKLCRGTSHKDGPRAAIFLGTMLPGMRALLDMEPTYLSALSSGLQRAYTHALKLAKPASTASSMYELEEDPQYSPHLFLDMAEALHIEPDAARELRSRPRGTKAALGGLSRLFEREVDRQLARASARRLFDPAALAFALHGFTLLDREVSSTAICQAAIRAIVASQNPDGTWPDGASALLLDTSASVQQPSIKTALCLAEVCLTKEDLVAYDRTRHAEDILPALDATARFLEDTFVETESTSGWVSDRVRWPKTSETWITAMSARFWFTYLTLKVSQRRTETLAKFEASAVSRADVQSIDVRKKYWEEEVVEPDQIAGPVKVLHRDLILPCIKKQSAGEWFVRPKVSSFIVYGPPGSGKTFFVKETARALGWPLITLNPGHFIEKGLEMIEAQSREVFDALLDLDHAVVLFDECDQLFVDRDPSPVMNTEDDKRVTSRDGINPVANTAGILSFLTASMLPKLQELNDRRRIVFIVATNYLSRIDPAIRRPGRFDQILFFDRPDEDACLKHLKQVWSERAGSCKRAMPSGSQALTIAKQCAGLTVKEIRTYAQEVADGTSAPPPFGTRKEYVTWCKKKGCRELDKDTNLNANKRKGIKARWRAAEKLVSTLTP